MKIVKRYDLIPPIKYPVINKYSFFIAPNQIKILQNSIIPKFTSSFQGKQKLQWESGINKLLPKKALGFSNDQEYLDKNNLTKNDIVKNSIKYILNDLELDDLEYLTTQFLICSNNCKIKIIQNEQKTIPVYIEIIDSLAYIKNIQKLIDNYPKHEGDHLGTKNSSSSPSTLLKVQLKMLKNRINGNFFNLSNDAEIQKTQKQISFIELALQDKYKNLPSWFNFLEIYIGFDNKLLDLNDIEKKSFTQLNSFFNGIKTSKEELLKSVGIFLRVQSKVKNEDKKDHKLLADNITNILRFYFKETIDEIHKKRKKVNTKSKREFKYTPASVKKEFLIKTYINETTIYANKNSNTNDHLFELFMESLNGIMGIENIFDQTKPKEDEISNFTALKNTLVFLKEFNFTKQEIKTIFYILQLQEKNKLTKRILSS